MSWQAKQFAVDLVILNERASSYIQDLQNAIETLVRASQSRLHVPLQPITLLPATALRLRDDQEETVIAETFETAFSIKADEDAKRLHTGAGLAQERVQEGGVALVACHVF